MLYTLSVRPRRLSRREPYDERGDLPTTRVAFRNPPTVDISLVIPAYNEYDNVVPLVDACHAAVAEVPGNHELLLINDGSTDATGALIDRLAAKDPFVQAIHHRGGENIGCHPSELEGMRAARGELMLFLPADLQIHPNVLPAFVAAAERADVIASHRVVRADPAWRRSLSAANNLVERLVIGVDVHDAHSSMALTRRAADLVLPRIGCDSALIPAEILIRAAEMELPVTEIPIEHHERAAGRQTGAKPSEVMRVHVDLLRLRHRLRREGVPRSGAGRSAL